MNNQFYNPPHAPTGGMAYSKPPYTNSLAPSGSGMGAGAGVGYGSAAGGLYGQQHGMGGMFDAGDQGGAQQQQQQQGQQGQQGQSQGQQQGQGPQQAQSAPSAIAPQQEMTLPSILHFLQSEWRRWERERNEWEIERADMRSRIALLEGLKRSSENAAADQKRRIVLLEYALKAERAKALGKEGSGSGAAGPGSASVSSGSPAVGQRANGTRKGTSLPDTSAAGPGEPELAAAGAEKEKKEGATHGKASSTGDREEKPASGWKTAVPFMARDPKARARSRDYLKQCLQEISYLTSPAALNPLPARIPLSSGPSSSDGDHAARMREVHDGLAVAVRPEKVLSEKPVEGEASKEAGAAEAEASDKDAAGSTTSESAPAASTEPPLPNGVATASDDETSQSGRTLVDSENGEQAGDSQPLLTAIYKPESKAAWKEALRSANEKAEQSRQELENGHPHELNHADMASLAEDAQSEASDASSSRIWRPVRQLRSHLDSVNAIAFGPNGSVVSGSTDCTVKYWRLDVASMTSGKSAANHLEQEPQATFRGHTSTVTAVAVSHSRRKIYSASLDSAIRVWNCPPTSADTYSAYDPDSACASLVGHTDAIWALALVPSKKDPEGWLVSASADGTIKVWDATAKDGRDPPLSSSWKYEADEEGSAEQPVPICIASQPSQLRNVLVGYTNGVLKSFELETGKEVQRYEIEAGDVEAAAVNAIICHPTLDVIVAAYDDGQIRYFDVQDGKLTHSTPAHSGSVTSLALDASTSTQFASSGSDCSVKIWDIESHDCLQEWSLHRKKGDEGVQQVAFSGGTTGQSLPLLSRSDEGLLCSAGGDGSIRVYTKEKEMPTTA